MTFPWLDGLNENQHKAVITTDGPVLVLSGAGTGKTRVLTARLAQIIATGKAKPWEILAVTFTNKAAKEMKMRVRELIGDEAEQVKLGTFHAIAARMLRRHAELVGLKTNFTILDSDDQIRLMKQILEAENIDTKRVPARMVAAKIDSWKDKGLGVRQVTAAQAGAFLDGRGGKIYQIYQERLKALNAADFGDLILHMLEIFTHHPDVLADYQRRLTHIMVDEYQDANVAQYLWLNHLVHDPVNFCCVGDDDQSIYKWRGAEIECILKFDTEYPTTHLIKLEENYRSTGHILSAASGLISHNKNRIGKTLFSSGEEGEKVRIDYYWDGRDEARAIAAKILERKHEGENLDKMAVLVRAGFQTREFEEQFLSAGVPYQIFGQKFYERAENRDAIAYLRLINQPDDDLAFGRIINLPKRGLGAASLKLIAGHARENAVSLMGAAAALGTSKKLKPVARKNLVQFCETIDEARSKIEEMPPAELAQFILDKSGYLDMWVQNTSLEAPGRVENLKELISAIGRFDTLIDFLEHIALVTENETETHEARVSVMTLHAAKGLEFDRVFLPGWEEGIFPSPRSIDEKHDEGLEEERRLAYVGITRARKYLHISYVANRQIYGSSQMTAPSLFIGELPTEHVVEDRAEAGERYAANWGRMGLHQQTDAREKQGEAGDEEAFDIEARVFHIKFGMGHVKLIEGDKVTVEFDKAGVKKIVASYLTHAGKV